MPFMTGVHSLLFLITTSLKRHARLASAATVVLQSSVGTWHEEAGSLWVCVRQSFNRPSDQTPLPAPELIVHRSKSGRMHSAARPFWDRSAMVLRDAPFL